MAEKCTKVNVSTEDFEMMMECPCVGNYDIAWKMAANYCNSSNVPCKQFCDRFDMILPYAYMGLSLLSALCCVLVFTTYRCMPRLRRTGYSSEVFLNRTVMDFIISLGHIFAGIFHLARSENMHACQALGVINQVALMASNLWYVFLAADLIRAIRNPFSSQPSYTWLSQLLVLLFSCSLAAVLGLLTILQGRGGPGTSMFYWCWVKVEQGDDDSKFRYFILVSFFLYYLWHIIFWVFSLVVIIAAGGILWGHLAASSETRKAVLKQNLKYVSVLGLETLFIVTFWLAQSSLVEYHYKDLGRRYFFTNYDVALAVMFAIIHSLRGTIDLLVWVWTFSIGPTDVTDCYRRHQIRATSKKESPVLLRSPRQLDTPLLSNSARGTLVVDKALRRVAIYCINIGILDAVQMDLDRCKRNCRVGSVRDNFAAAALMDLDHENQIDEVALLYGDPNYREQPVRRIRFPASSSHLKEFSFIDLEPTVFSMLRQTYGISPRTYRKSFEIKNAADIDSSLMFEKFTEGKSGSFFYFTQDYRFIIKTVSAAEEKFLCKIAYDYYQHMRTNEDSLIVRFFGLHKVRLAPEQRFITVVVMDNIFYNTDMLKIHRRFDLKGSWVGRRSLKSRQSSEGYKGTLKDLDLGEEKVLIGAEQKEQLMDQLRKDVQFLTKCHIMDYSLLLGIHQHGSVRDSTASKNVESKFGDFIAVDTPVNSSTEIYQSPDKKSRAFSTRNDTMTSTYGFDRELHVPWFRQDNGGLQSVSNLPSDLEDRPPRDSMVNVSNPPVTYFFGVVDILQQYTLRKKVEHVWKTRVLRQNLHGLSAVNENEYGERFLKFLDGVVQ